ncbi:MAG: glycosyltransferase [Janthinobacterium lividum]
MSNLAMPARFHAAREAMATAAVLPRPSQLLGPPTTPAQLARSLRRQLPAPAATLQACVIIPAKDEAHHLPATLAALAAQTELHGALLPAGCLEVIVLANNCCDCTADVVRQFASCYPALAVHVAELQLPGELAHVGQARRLLMDAAAQRLEATAGPTGLILSTDADTLAAPDWLAACRAEVAAGAVAVGGRILTSPGTFETQSTELAPADAEVMTVADLAAVRRTQLRDATYHLLRNQLESQLDPCQHDPWPRHHQHFGASLAITVAAYRQVGGLPVVRYLEDEALWRALCRQDLPVRHSPRVRVRTSARQQGRVEVGLSWQLREWATHAQEQREPEVDCPRQLAALWQARRELRAWWQGQSQPTPAGFREWALMLGVQAGEMHDKLKGAKTFGEFWYWVLGTRASAVLAQPYNTRVPLSKAIAWLREAVRRGSCEF